jgi:hypothetical protein
MKKISNLHELSAEKQRLQQRLALLKRELNSDITEIKDRFKPITRIVSLFTGGGDTSGSNGDGEPKPSLLKMGTNFGIDLLVGSKLRKAGMLTRLIAPPLMRGIASTVINKIKQFRSRRETK